MNSSLEYKIFQGQMRRKRGRQNYMVCLTNSDQQFLTKIQEHANSAVSDIPWTIEDLRYHNSAVFVATTGIESQIHFLSTNVVVGIVTLSVANLEIFTRQKILILII